MVIRGKRVRCPLFGFESLSPGSSISRYNVPVFSSPFIPGCITLSAQKKGASVADL